LSRSQGRGRQEDQAAAGPRYERERAILAEALLRGECVVFAGAGLSAAALPQWSELVDLLSQALPELQAHGATPGDFLDIAQWYVEEFGRERLLQEIVRLYGVSAAEPTPLAQAVAALPTSLYFTTNYDLSLEQALRQLGDLPDVVIRDSHVALIDERHRTTVVKLHGCVTEPDSIVLTREDFATYGETHRAAITYLQSLLATRTFLFVGFSFADPNFRLIYQAIQRALGTYRREVYALLLDPNNNLLVRHWQRQGVRLLTFPNEGGEASMLDFVQALGQAAAARQAESALPGLVRQLAADELVDLPQAAELAALLERAVPLADALLDQGAKGPAKEAPRLLRLAESLADAGLPVAARRWLPLGEALLAAGEPALALRALARARHRPSSGTPVGDTREGRRLAGDLAQAYLRAADPARAAALLRDLARRSPGGQGDLAESWLRERPEDLLTLVSAERALAERRAEQGEPQQAREQLAGLARLLAAALASGLLRGDCAARARQLAGELAGAAGPARKETNGQP
jgi:hypothetical protein